MTPDHDLMDRLTRVGDHLDDLARRADADVYDPFALRRTTRPQPRRHLLAVAAVVIAVGLVGGFVAVGKQHGETVVGTGQPSGSTAQARLLSAHPVIGQAIADTCKPGWVPSGFGVCFLLGPASFTAADVAQARAINQQGAWGLSISLTGSTRPAANRMFDACFDAGAACPDLGGSTGHGVVAFVSDGQVIAVPAIQALSLADHELQILPGGRGARDTGLTRSEAEALAARLR